MNDVRLEAPHAQRQDRKAPRDVQEALREAARALASDAFAGTYVDLAKVPAPTRKRWNGRLGRLRNLYKVDLPQAWRALYTVGSDGGMRLVLVIEVLSHKEYDRLLGYKTS